MKDAFRAAAPSDIEAIFSLYEKRVRWMDENGVRQWNVTDYLTVYPAAYYREQQAAGRLFALYDGDAPIGAVVLLDEDPLWPDGLPACYIHNLVTDPAVSGAGRRILRAVEALAARRGVRACHDAYQRQSANRSSTSYTP